MPQSYKEQVKIEVPDVDRHLRSAAKGGAYVTFNIGRWRAMRSATRDVCRRSLGQLQSRIRAFLPAWYEQNH